jgi:hypothetical protein
VVAAQVTAGARLRARLVGGEVDGAGYADQAHAQGKSSHGARHFTHPPVTLYFPTAGLSFSPHQDCLSGLSDELFVYLPDPFSQSRDHKKQRLLLPFNLPRAPSGSSAGGSVGGAAGGAAGGGAAGGAAGGGAAGGGAPPPVATDFTPLTFRRNDPLLNGRGQLCEQYLVAYTRSYCGPALDMVRQRRMTTDAHRVVHGVSITGQEPVPPINPEFTRRMITGGTRGARKGGLETWWRSPAGIEARVASCNGGSNKCGID